MTVLYTKGDYAKKIVSENPTLFIEEMASLLELGVSGKDLKSTPFTPSQALGYAKWACGQCGIPVKSQKILKKTMIAKKPAISVSKPKVPVTEQSEKIKNDNLTRLREIGERWKAGKKLEEKHDDPEFLKQDQD
jgi:hypothetical protein